jgi:hypothetical protein
MEGTTPSGIEESHQREQRRAVIVEFARPNSKMVNLYSCCILLYVSLTIV